MDNFKKFLWGIAFIVVGIIIGINAFDLAEINIFFDGWWTLFIIIPNLIELFNRNKSNRFGNFIWLIIGVILLLATRDVITYDILSRMFIPFIFVAIGLSIIFNNLIKDKVSEKIRASSKDGLDSIVATFAEQKINMDDEEFKGANVESIFGSVVLDLRKAKLDKEAVIKASAIFGGIEVIVPSNTNIKVKSTPIFGGVSNKISNSETNKQTIYVEVFCLFGGMDIK
ncbi:MAG: LiaF-related protein [Bacilli bacterium]|nr:LiaF-related protein [Bacilli bacterium]MDD4282259.1 LiaF-related protein [Bacilli bacterium]MDD4718639.1 LiaF-related protein [Bacilli bacterium]